VLALQDDKGTETHNPFILRVSFESLPVLFAWGQSILPAICPIRFREDSWHGPDNSNPLERTAFLLLGLQEA